MKTDYSRMNYMIEQNLLGTGYESQSVIRVMKECSPNIDERKVGLTSTGKLSKL